MRVLVVDDHELFRIGLRQLLEEEGFAVADARCVDTALRRLPGLAPDVVIVGVNRWSESVPKATRLIRHAAPLAGILVLALVAQEEHIVPTVRAGATGYILKGAELTEIVAGIRAVAGGQSALSAGVGRVLIEHIRRSDPDVPSTVSTPPEPHELSKRERQVLALLASGCDNAEIGDTLFVSRSTVKNHVSRLLEKLDVDNRVQAATYAVRSGLADDPQLRPSRHAR